MYRIDKKHLLSAMPANTVSRKISILFRDNKDLKGRQAKQSMDTSKLVMADKSIKNKAERER